MCVHLQKRKSKYITHKIYEYIIKKYLSIINYNYYMIFKQIMTLFSFNYTKNIFKN